MAFSGTCETLDFALETLPLQKSREQFRHNISPNTASFRIRRTKNTRAESAYEHSSVNPGLA